VVDDLGFALFAALAGEPHALSLPRLPNVEVPRDVLDRYLGRYELAPGANVSISRDGPNLWARFPVGQGRLLASSATEFRMRANPSVRILFRRGPDGAPELVLDDRGEHIVAPRR
jgi:hypothetical protein